MPLVGAAAATGGLARWATAAPRPSYFLITDTPDADRLALYRAAGAARWHVTTTPIEAAAQDLSLLVEGAVVDPTRNAHVARPVATFAHDVRRRSRPGRFLLTLEPAPATDDAATFSYDGRIVDRVRLDRNYDRIEMPGVMGPTVFRLHDGHLSVVTSSCRHELCRKMGTRASGKIICAPNRLVATLPGRPGLIDAVTG